jgi:LPXTG-motif cell wall-anchored protein
MGWGFYLIFSLAAVVYGWARGDSTVLVLGVIGIVLVLAVAGFVVSGRKRNRS